MKHMAKCAPPSPAAAEFSRQTASTAIGQAEVPPTSSKGACQASGLCLASSHAHQHRHPQRRARLPIGPKDMAYIGVCGKKAVNTARSTSYDVTTLSYLQ